ncbi:spore coat protein [Priestia aryabhattai]|uniref:Spore coat protein n=1 Tax=Priestia aryabhattai TaxID=412384 RepID=A0ABD7X4R0_PRIAR|nr:spore coat protein [Priestia aryabhattai]WEA47232.1 spore coat protein [Priestia aryabhattai]
MNERKWRALDHCENERFSGKDVSQEADQIAVVEQNSWEKIIIRDSESVRVQTTDTQIAATIQLALQAAIAIVVRITIGDNDQGDRIVQEFKQVAAVTKQQNNQKTVIENSVNVNVTTIDTSVAVNLQLLLQVLLAILFTLEII